MSVGIIDLAFISDVRGLFIGVELVTDRAS